MSCLVLDLERLRRVGGLIHALTLSGHVLHGFYGVTDALEPLKTATKTQFFNQALTRAVRIAHIVNVKAYRAAYAHRQDSKFSGIHLSNGRRLRLVSVKPLELGGDASAVLCPLLKTLECLHYNCIDGGQLKKYPQFFEQLNGVIEAVRALIIYNLPAYQAADWS